MRTPVCCYSVCNPVACMHGRNRKRFWMETQWNLSVLCSVWKCFLYLQIKHHMSVMDDVINLLRSMSGYHKQSMKKQNETVVKLQKGSLLLGNIRKSIGNKLVIVNWNGSENLFVFLFFFFLSSTVICSAVLTYKDQIRCEFWYPDVCILIMLISTYACVYIGYFRGFFKAESW